jgi:3-oxoadipate enol-lactonase
VDDVGTGPPVLAIHGLGGGAHFFGGLAQRLKDDYRIVSIDLPGTGRSSAPRYSMETWVADLEQLVAEHIKQPVVVIGHSMGTIVALKAWDAWPQYVRGLIFVGGLPRVRPVIHDRLTQRVDALQGAQDLAGWGQQVSPGVFARRTLSEQPELVACFERAFEANSVESYVNCCGILLGASAESIAPRVEAPCLAITGEEDGYAPPDAVAAFARLLPTTPRVEVLPACAHLPFFEAPNLFASTVRAFLRTC